MKYICLGYLEPGKFEVMTEGERHTTFDECFERQVSGGDAIKIPRDEASRESSLNLPVRRRLSESGHSVPQSRNARHTTDRRSWGTRS